MTRWPALDGLQLRSKALWQLLPCGELLTSFHHRASSWTCSRTTRPPGCVERRQHCWLRPPHWPPTDTLPVAAAAGPQNAPAVEAELFWHLPPLCPDGAGPSVVPLRAAEDGAQTDRVRRHLPSQPQLPRSSAGALRRVSCGLSPLEWRFFNDLSHVAQMLQPGEVDTVIGVVRACLDRFARPAASL